MSLRESTLHLIHSLQIVISVSDVSVNAGSKATYTITLTPLGGSYGSNVSLSCSGLPNGAKCPFSPSNISLGSNAVNSTVTVTTNSQSRGSSVITFTGTCNNTPTATATLIVN